MKRQRISFILLSFFALVALVSLSVPKPAQASPEQIPHNWFEATYKGYDSFYGNHITAYETGKTAKLVGQLWNNTGTDVNIKQAKVRFDWGEEYTTTNFPTELKKDKAGLAAFEFTVPPLVTASNWTMHQYEIAVVYEVQDGPRVVNRKPWEYVGTGNGITTIFYLDHTPVAPGTVTIYLVDPTAKTITPTTDYTIDNYTGKIEFTTAPSSGIVIRADYKYVEIVGQGDGLRKVFYLDYPLIAPGSQTIYLVDDVAKTITAVATTDYSIDNERGKITLKTAPTSWQRVAATYETYEYDGGVWTASGFNFVVYSADQAAYQELQRKFSALRGYDVWDPKGMELAVQAKYEQEMAEQDYRDGDFASAMAHYEKAIELQQQAIAKTGETTTSLIDTVKNLGTKLGTVSYLYLGFLIAGIAVLLLSIAAIINSLRRPRA